MLSPQRSPRPKGPNSTAGNQRRGRPTEAVNIQGAGRKPRAYIEGLTDPQGSRVLWSACARQFLSTCPFQHSWCFWAKPIKARTIKAAATHPATTFFIMAATPGKLWAFSKRRENLPDDQQHHDRQHNVDDPAADGVHWIALYFLADLRLD